MNWRSGRSLIAAFSLSLIVSGCGSFPGKEPLARTLPATPGFAVAASVPAPRNGEPVLAIAARERAARKQNASTITKLRNWYSGVRKSYGAP
jgi:hypothetical protein